MSRPVLQPLHPSVRDALDPQYVKYHDEVVQFAPAAHERGPFHPSHRGPPLPGGSAIRPVGSVKDYDLGKFQVRVFTPEGQAPSTGWPALLWLHGGGWVLGSIDSENAQCSAFTKEARCVTVAVDYRLAPEHAWPAAVDDAVEALQWLHASGPELLGINPKQLVVGGSSAGANLAAILSLHAPRLSPPIPILLQLLNVPAVNQTLMPDSEEWTKRPHAPWLPAEKMLWYRRLYLPNEADWSHPDASPILAKKEHLAKSPKTLVCVAEQDVLCAEGVAYAELLRELGVQVTIKQYKGSTHNLMAADAVLDSGRQLVQDNIDALVDIFRTHNKQIDDL